MKFTFTATEFGKHVKQKRVIEEDIDLRTLSKRINVSPATISRIENGSLPDLRAYAILCHYIGKPMADFIKVKSK